MIFFAKFMFSFFYLADNMLRGTDLLTNNGLIWVTGGVYDIREFGQV